MWHADLGISKGVPEMFRQEAVLFPGVYQGSYTGYHCVDRDIGTSTHCRSNHQDNIEPSPKPAKLVHVIDERELEVLHCFVLLM
jgi:hypothetical protein